MNNHQQIKKSLLIISSYAPPMIAGGAHSLYTLLSHFPSDKFSVLTSYNVDWHTQGGPWLPCNYFFINHRPISLFERQKTRQLKGFALSTMFRRIAELTKNFFFLIRPVKVVILWVLFFSKIVLFITCGRRLIKTIQPEILVGVSDDGPAMYASYWLSQHYAIPLVYLLFDIYYGNNLDAPGDWFARRFEERILSSAKRIIVTNEGTQRFYRERYPLLHDQIIVIPNSVFPEDYQLADNDYAPVPPFQIIFTGNIYWAQEQSLSNLITAMSLLEDFPVELHIYAAARYGVWYQLAKNKKNVYIHNFVSRAEVGKLQREADLLFLPLAWNTKAPDIITTASPGKFTDYLGSGRPLLIHAPEYAYISRYCREHQLGLVVDDNNTNLLAKTIRDFFTRPDVGKEYVQNAITLFQLEYDARKNAEKLTHELNMV